MRIRLGFPLIPCEIANTFNCVCDTRNGSQKITHIVIDSREARAGDLFIPVKGQNFDGEDFVDDAIARGATVVSVKPTGHGIILNKTDNFLLKLAKWYKSKLKHLKHTIAITGSVGKSTTKEFVKRLTEGKFKVHASAGNYNNTVGVPLSILQASPDTEVLIAEAGMNHFGELSLISECLEPSIAVITNIGSAHIGNFGTRENIAKAKKEIAVHSAKAVFVPYSEEYLTDVPHRITVSTKHKEAQIYLEAGVLNSSLSEGMVFKNRKSLTPFNIKIAGRHILECLAFAVAIADYLGIDAKSISQGVNELSYGDVRQKFLYFKNFSIFDDSYNSSPEALTAAFELLALHNNAEKSALIGDMLELGKDAEKFHFEAGLLAAKYSMRRLYLFGKYSPFVMNGACSGGMNKNDILINTDTTAAIKTAKQIMDNYKLGEIILFKASNALNLSVICDYLRTMEG